MVVLALGIASFAHAAQTSGPKGKQQTLILEFDSKDGAATNTAKGQPATRAAARPTKQRAMIIERPTTGPAAADSAVTAAAAEEDSKAAGPIKPAREIGKTAAMITVASAGVVGVILAFLRKRRESAY
jgi:hypothetical protein